MSLVECLIITSNPKSAYPNLEEFLGSNGNLLSQLAQTRRTFCHATVQKESGRVASHYVTCLLSQEVFDHLYQRRDELSAQSMKLEAYDFTKTPGPSSDDKPHLVVYLKNLPSFRERGWLFARVETVLRSLTKLGYIKPAKVHAMRNSGGEIDASILKIYFDDSEPERNRCFVSALFNNMSFYVPHDIAVQGSKFLLHRIKNSWMRNSNLTAPEEEEEEKPTKTKKPNRRVVIEDKPQPSTSRPKKTLSRPKPPMSEEEEEED